MNEDTLASWMGLPSRTTVVEAPPGPTSHPDVRHSLSLSKGIPPSALDRSTRPSSSGNASSQSLKEAARASRLADLARTKATAPPVFAKPPRPSQTQLFQPDKSPAWPKGKVKKPSKKTKGIVDSDDEEPERAAALSSLPKGGARPTSAVSPHHAVSSLRLTCYCRPLSTLSRSRRNRLLPTPRSLVSTLSNPR